MTHIKLLNHTVCYKASIRNKVANIKTNITNWKWYGNSYIKSQL